MTTQHAAILAQAESNWDVAPVLMHFRNPLPPTVTMRAQRTDIAADPVLMTVELAEDDLVAYDADGNMAHATLNALLHRAAGRIVADLRSRET